MNYTKNHHLPQWVESDPIRMKDFNDAMASIESGLNAAGNSSETQAAVADAVSKAEAAQAAANSAQSTANAAQTAAQNADAKADAAQAAATALPFVAGTYTGTGRTQTISLGFRPSFLIASGMQPSKTSDSLAEFVRYFAMTGFYNTGTISTRIQLTSEGFVVYPAGNAGTYAPDLNESGRVYEYLAFKS